MKKTVVRRLLRLLVTGGLCLTALTTAGAVNQGKSSARTPEALTAGDWNPRILPGERPGAGKEKEQEVPRTSALLAREGLTEAQRSALAARMEREPALLERLERGELSDAALALLALPNARTDRLDRYLARMRAYPEYSAEHAVLWVNTDRDRAFYSAVSEAADPSGLTVLVNKHYALPADYVPVLEALGSGYGSGSLRPEAARAFRAMADAARAEGISLRSVSAYRSYAAQNTIYNNYLKSYPQSEVDTFSARPGSSEHQTGLALDINVASRRANFETTPAFAWLKAHCAEYGFILRYEKEKEAVTGYCFEPWHYRYVGVDIARACMEQGLCYEEYLALQNAAD